MNSLQQNGNNHGESNEDFMTWFEQQPIDYKRTVSACLEQLCIDTGIVPAADGTVGTMSFDDASILLQRRLDGTEPLPTRKAMADDGIAVNQLEDADQARCDIIASSLLGDVDI